MRELGERVNIPITVFGPETHMTKIVPMAIEYINGYRPGEGAQHV